MRAELNTHKFELRQRIRSEAFQVFPCVHAKLLAKGIFDALEKGRVRLLLAQKLFYRNLVCAMGANKMG